MPYYRVTFQPHNPSPTELQHFNAAMIEKGYSINSDYTYRTLEQTMDKVDEEIKGLIERGVLVTAYTIQREF